MKKLFFFKSIFLLLLATNLHAALEDFYLGVAYSSGSGEIEQENSSVTKSGFDSTAASFKVGYMLENEERIVISYETLKMDLDAGFTWYGQTQPEIRGFNADAFFTLPISNFSPFLMLGLGSYSLEDSAKHFVKEYDLSAVSFNYGLGFFYMVDSIELELSYNGKYLSWEDVESNNVKTSTKTTIDYFSVGINIHF